MSLITDSYVQSIALVIRAVDKINDQTGGRDGILRNSTSGGAAFPVNTRPTENNVLAAPETGKGGSLSVTA